jgi:hypothetical protein
VAREPSPDQLDTADGLDRFFASLRPQRGHKGAYWLGGSSPAGPLRWRGHFYRIYRSHKEMDFYESDGSRWTIADMRFNQNLPARHGLSGRLFKTRREALAALRSAMEAEAGLARAKPPVVRLHRARSIQMASTYYTTDNQWVIFAVRFLASPPRWKLLPNENVQSGAKEMMQRHLGADSARFQTRKEAVMALQQMLDAEYGPSGDSLAELVSEL